jgi:hypothetical protein
VARRPQKLSSAILWVVALTKWRKVERIAWVATIVSVVLAVAFWLFPLQSRDGSNTSTVTGNQGPVVVAQSSPNAKVVVNVPPVRQKTDQDNCSAGERWVGMTPHRAEWFGKLPADRAKLAVFHGEFRWTPVVNERTNTTRGVVRLEVDGRSTIIYEWNSPDTVTHEFEIPLGQHLKNSSGEYRITWLFKSGSSGICVARSEVTA